MNLNVNAIQKKMIQKKKTNHKQIKMALDKKSGIDPKLINKAYAGMKKRKSQMGKCKSCGKSKDKCKC